MEIQAVVGPTGRTFKISLSFIRYFLLQNIRDRGMQPTNGHEELERVGIVPGVRDGFTPRLHGLLTAHHGLGDPVLLLVHERRVEERRHQLQQGRVGLLPAAIPLLVVPDIDQQQPRSAGLQHPLVHVVCPVVPPLFQPDQAKVLHAVRKRLVPPAVVVAVAKEGGLCT